MSNLFIAAKLIESALSAGMVIDPRSKQSLAFIYPETKLVCGVTDAAAEERGVEQIAVQIVTADRTMPVMLLNTVDHVGEFMAILNCEIEKANFSEEQEVAKAQAARERLIRVISREADRAGFVKISKPPAEPTTLAVYAAKHGSPHLFCFSVNYANDAGRLTFHVCEENGIELKAFSAYSSPLEPVGITAAIEALKRDQMAQGDTLN
jgi:hypothetical protein